MENRVRMGFKPLAKGVVSIDVTAESDDPETTATLLRDGIVNFRAIADEQGFPVVEGAE